MHTLQNQIIVAALLMFLCAGCSDRDRELAGRKGDGSDTFKYKAPDTNTPPPQDPGVKKSPAKDGSDTFRYKPDSRGFPTPPKSAGK